MRPLSAADLYSLEKYHTLRSEFRARVLAHKRNRHIALGPNATLYFEDRLTIQYQVQEMLRAERIFEAEAIRDELAAYNPLIPSGSNLKATFMIEFPDVAQRRDALGRLGGIEHHVSLRVDEQAPIVAVADEDLDRSADEKTSAVHFLRFEFSREAIAALRAGAPLSASVDYPGYSHVTAIDEPSRSALLADFD